MGPEEHAVDCHAANSRSGRLCSRQGWQIFFPRLSRRSVAQIVIRCHLPISMHLITNLASIAYSGIGTISI